MANLGLTGDVLRRLGAQLRTIRKAARLTQADVCLALGMKGVSSRSYLHRLEKGVLRNVSFLTVVRYLQACKVPIGKFVLELAQSGAFGEAEQGLTIVEDRAKADGAKRAKAQQRNQRR